MGRFKQEKTKRSCCPGTRFERGMTNPTGKLSPKRFAQEALGHNSKAVHRAHAKRALMKIPSLEDYEQKAATISP